MKMMMVEMVDGCQMTDNYQNNIVNDYSDGYAEDKPEIRKFCELVFHDSRAVPDLASPVVVVPAFHVDQRPVGNLLPNIFRLEALQCFKFERDDHMEKIYVACSEKNTNLECEDLECCGKRLV